MRRRIHNIQSLNRSIFELREKRKDIEAKLDANFSNLKGNYFNMTLNTMFGNRKSPGHFWADIVSRVMESEKLQHGIGDLVTKAADKIGEALRGKG
ncbi:MAG: hypothetical protein EBS95_03945 [Chitinophagia bacterium]|jgi:hypothetical protein|nr:hypothetical protein [Chitinophagia bacterium]